MRPNNQQRRPRGRNGGGGGNHGGGGGGGGHKGGKPQRNQTYDSNGPEVRVRGNAHQIFEKYQVLAREAAAAGDRIAAESYYQHAEHYLRLINLSGGFQQQRGPGWNDGENFEEGGDNRGGDGRNEQRQQDPRDGRHNGPNGYNGREERPYQGREQNNGVDPEGDQPDLPVAAFPQTENS
jgi:hypothetical protein